MSSDDTERGLRDFSAEDYAEAALMAAMREDTAVAIFALESLIEVHGMSALYVAVLRWCDTYHHHAVDGQDPPGGIARVSVMDERTGKIQSEDDESLEPAFRWAAKLVVARSNMDVFGFNALWDELGTVDPVMRGNYVMTLLITIARTIRGLPRGFAVMGMDAGW